MGYDSQKRTGKRSRLRKIDFGRTAFQHSKYGKCCQRFFLFLRPITQLAVLIVAPALLFLYPLGPNAVGVLNTHRSGVKNGIEARPSLLLIVLEDLKCHGRDQNDGQQVGPSMIIGAIFAYFVRNLGVSAWNIPIVSAKIMSSADGQNCQTAQKKRLLSGAFHR